MFSKRILWAVAAAWVLSHSNFAAAQYDPRPVSRTGGAATEALNQIVREDVGTGFSSSSLNMIALQNSQARVPYVGQSSTQSGGSRIGLGLGGSGGSKPFSGFTPDPTVSPYLNLFREDLEGGGDLNYNTLVRPMLQQQQVNQQVQRQAVEFQRKLQGIAAQSDFNPQGAKDIYPTGHQTAFRYFGHYYPGMQRARGR